jgi:predicted RNA-binding Zn-ribbon protein involved in translation (DUF1610 family)
MTWIGWLKLRALAWTVAILAAIVAAIMMVGVPWLPVVGVGVAALVVSINKLAHRLDSPHCLACGHSLVNQPTGAHGIACPDCGAINLPRVASKIDESAATSLDDTGDDVA